MIDTVCIIESLDTVPEALINWSWQNLAHYSLSQLWWVLGDHIHSWRASSFIQLICPAASWNWVPCRFLPDAHCVQPCLSFLIWRNSWKLIGQGWSLVLGEEKRLPAGVDRDCLGLTGRKNPNWHCLSDQKTILYLPPGTVQPSATGFWPVITYCHKQ